MNEMRWEALVVEVQKRAREHVADARASTRSAAKQAEGIRKAAAERIHDRLINAADASSAAAIASMAMAIVSMVMSAEGDAGAKSEVPDFVKSGVVNGLGAVASKDQSEIAAAAHAVDSFEREAQREAREEVAQMHRLEKLIQRVEEIRAERIG